jgi:hypothetical protein
MTQREWMVVAERLMNLMESFDYKSEQYNVCRKVLLAHLAKKPDHDEEEGHAWTMTGPAPFEAETPLPAITNIAKRKTVAKKTAAPKPQDPQVPSSTKPKRVRKKRSSSTAKPGKKTGPMTRHG